MTDEGHVCAGGQVDRWTGGWWARTLKSPGQNLSFFTPKAKTFSHQVTVNKDDRNPARLVRLTWC